MRGSSAAPAQLHRAEYVHQVTTRVNGGFTFVFFVCPETRVASRAIAVCFSHSRTARCQQRALFSFSPTTHPCHLPPCNVRFALYVVCCEREECLSVMASATAQSKWGAVHCIGSDGFSALHAQRHGGGREGSVNVQRSADAGPARRDRPSHLAAPEAC